MTYRQQQQALGMHENHLADYLAQQLPNSNHKFQVQLCIFLDPISDFPLINCSPIFSQFMFVCFVFDNVHFYGFLDSNQQCCDHALSVFDVILLGFEEVRNLIVGRLGFV